MKTKRRRYPKWTLRHINGWKPGKPVPPWGTMRGLIWRRDKGVCWACGLVVPFDAMQLGHLVDRCAGGLDVPPNLAVMCGSCNIMEKPVHDTLEQAERWRNGIRWRVAHTAPVPWDDDGWLTAAADLLEGMTAAMRAARER